MSVCSSASARLNSRVSCPCLFLRWISSVETYVVANLVCDSKSGDFFRYTSKFMARL